jgi:tRNA-5-taurinomethyluridine 2-sulfurtransferase
MKYAALVSGGVDSAVALHLMKEKGINPDIFYIKIGMENEHGFIDCAYKEDVEMVMQMSRKYGLRMEIVDLHEDYWNTVVRYTLESVKKGLTPNPDIMCNKLIKFGLFEDRTGKEYDKTITGHYAGTLEKEGYTWLCTALDTHKDQSYFLSQLSQKQLKKLFFPLEQLKKQEVRQKALEAALPCAERPDSQGICFLGKINYKDFIKRYLGEKKGTIVELESGKILGEHKGYWFYTIGQRQGLGLGQGPWFVIKKDIEENIIYVSQGYDPEAQYADTIYVSAFHFLSKEQNYEKASRISFKIRHSPEFHQGSILKKGNSYVLVSDEKIAGIAPGQFAVVYDTERQFCLGSGVISTLFQ